ncbi:GAF domain-containing sensor histidine kinase [Arthrobacter agilis]|uniref:GAF domain-containing sensor histidine kinase n=1 Tax=Arthrobacter agilis TaxID=37921 RepID=UPI002364FF3F|nr:GAF domain-containing sensor histidine kinase [Arthrobacter agilis]WDF31850.1 GAF domain-containing sensor histidine kinase [Arthrobacter agilis]
MVTYPDELPRGSDRRPLAGVEHLLAAFAAIADDLGLDTVLERVIAAACQLVDARYGALGVIGGDRRLSHFITVGLEEDEIRRIGPLPTGHGVLGLLITEPRPVRLSDLREHPLAYGFPAHHPQMTSFLGVPIRIHGRVFGNLYLTEKNGGVDFSDADEQLVVSLASAAGVAIENSRLFDEATRRTRWLEGGLNAVRELLGRQGRDRDDLEILSTHALTASQSIMSAVLREFGTERDVICEAADGIDVEVMIGRQSHSSTLPERLPTSLAPILLDEDDVAVVLPGAGRSIGAALCCRLPGEGDRRFLLVGRPPGASVFSDVDHEMMRTFASHVSLALELVRVHRQQEQEAVFGDRDRIARDLHDLVIQRLFAAGLSIQSLRKYTPNTDALGRITAITTELDATIKELRDTIYSLRSVPQITPTFTSTVFALVADAFDGHELAPVLQLSGPLDTAVDGEQADHVRAVLLEGLSNALRHAEARAITVTMRAAGDRLVLEIADDGRGFEGSSRRSGLENMKRRAELCGGSLSITSTLGGGTTVRLEIPLPATATTGSPIAR